MRRFISLNDFDWVLLGLVLALSVISVLEIYSATLHTKFVGFDKNQVLWLLGGMVAMFAISLINYHRLLSIAVWAYGIGLVALVAVLAVGTKVLGGRRWIKFPGGIHFQPSEWVKLILIVAVGRLQRNGDGRRSNAAGIETTRLGNRAYLFADPPHGAVSRWNQLAKGADSNPGGVGGDWRNLGQWQSLEALPEGAANQFHES